MIPLFTALTRELSTPFWLLNTTGLVEATNDAALGLLPEGASLRDWLSPTEFADWLSRCLGTQEAVPLALFDQVAPVPLTGMSCGDGCHLVLQRTPPDHDAPPLRQIVAALRPARSPELPQLLRLQAVAAALAGAATVEQVATILVEQVSAVLHASGSVVYTVEGEALRLLSSRGIEAATVAALAQIPLSSPWPLPTAVRQRRPLWRRPAPSLPGAPPWHAHPLLALPLVTPQRVLGAAAFILDGELEGQPRLLVETIAQLCAQALGRARLGEAELAAWEKVERLEREVRTASARANEAERRRDELLAILGHELRNPLAPILTALDLMRLRGPHDLFAHERTAIEQQVRHLSRLVDDLLDVSRVTRGTLELRCERIEASEVVGRAIDLAGPLLEKQRHELVLQIPKEGLALDGDPVRLAQAVSHLVNNAAKYTPPGGQIVVSGTREGDAILIRVRDTGQGIAPELLDRIFELFVQGPQALDRAVGGLGIGLHLVRSIVEKHGGTVSVFSEGQGRGAELTLRLPAARGYQRRPRELAPAEGAADRRRILIVDDNVDAAELLGQLLRSRGHETALASDGPMALATAGAFHPDVVLLDIGLPVMDGYEVARRLRQMPALESTAILALTGYGQPTDRRRSAAAGFDDHLTKPITLDRLLTALSRAQRPAAKIGSRA